MRNICSQVIAIIVNCYARIDIILLYCIVKNVYLLSKYILFRFKDHPMLIGPTH